MKKDELAAERLSAEALAVTPVNYRSIRFIQLVDSKSVRMAESSWYRSKGMSCYVSQRLISKCFQEIPVPARGKPADRKPLEASQVGARPQITQTVGDDRAFRLFACCIAVRGARRSVICDLQRQTFRFIPNGLYDILTEHADETLAQIKAAYENAYDREIDQYFDFLIEHEFGFWCDEPESFPSLELDWEAPERITNAILDIDHASGHDFAKIVRQLDALGCKAIEVRFFSAMSPGTMREILAAMADSRLRSIQLLGPHNDELTHIDWHEMSLEHPRLDKVFLCSAPKDDKQELDTGLVLFHRQQQVDSPTCCGEVHAAYFVTTMATFIEGQEHNTCLNRKISIDKSGEIKNCPSLPDSYGNIRDTTLAEALAKPGFDRWWQISKDQIEVCRDCEFRYICTDCRAFTEDPDDPYSKPAKCTYDPYNARWQ